MDLRANAKGEKLRLTTFILALLIHYNQGPSILSAVAKVACGGCLRRRNTVLGKSERELWICYIRHYNLNSLKVSQHVAIIMYVGRLSLTRSNLRQGGIGPEANSTCLAIHTITQDQNRKASYTKPRGELIESEIISPSVKSVQRLLNHSGNFCEIFESYLGQLLENNMKLEQYDASAPQRIILLPFLRTPSVLYRCLPRQITFFPQSLS